MQNRYAASFLFVFVILGLSMGLSGAFEVQATTTEEVVEETEEVVENEEGTVETEPEEVSTSTEEVQATSTEAEAEDTQATSTNTSTTTIEDTEDNSTSTQDVASSTTPLDVLLDVFEDSEEVLEVDLAIESASSTGEMVPEVLHIKLTGDKMDANFGLGENPDFVFVLPEPVSTTSSSSIQKSGVVHVLEEGERISDFQKRRNSKPAKESGTKDRQSTKTKESAEHATETSDGTSTADTVPDQSEEETGSSTPPVIQEEAADEATTSVEQTTETADEPEAIEEEEEVESASTTAQESFFGPFFARVVDRLFPRTFAQNEQGTANTINIVDKRLYRPGGSGARNTILATVEDGVLEVAVERPDQGFIPGKYRLEVDVMENGVLYTVAQEFLWGVLAVNVNKSEYSVGEEVYIQMAALTQSGDTVCDANLKLTVEAPGGFRRVFTTENSNIVLSGECGENNVTDIPDYFAYHVVSETGEHILELENLDTGHKITDQFSVVQDAVFAIERIGATRINPFKATYVMQVLLTSHDGFEGRLVERVPSDFIVVRNDADDALSSETEQLLVWEVALEPGEQRVFEYVYQAPLASPRIFFLGAAQVISKDTVLEKLFGSGAELLFEESRRWQLASDAAVSGHYHIRRNDAETDNLTTANFDSTWDTEVASHGSSIAYSGGTFTLEAGKYLVLWSERYDTTETANNERIEVQGKLVLDGTEVEEGAGQTYLRKLNTNQAGVLNGSAILDITSGGTTLDIRFRRTDSTTDIAVDRVPDWGGVTVLALDDTWNYARYSRSSSVAVPDAFADVVWQDNDEQDAGFSRASGDITITSAGRYLVTYSVPINKTANSNRKEYISRMTLNDVEIEGTRTSTYMRGNESTDDGVLSYVGIIDVGASDVLAMEIDRTTGTAAATIDADSNIQIVQLPVGNETIILEATSGEYNPATVTEFAWDTTAHEDAAAFTHTNPTDSFFDVDVAGDYLFFASQNTTNGGVRTFTSARFSVNDVISDYAVGGQYNRSTGGADQAGHSHGTLLTGLAAGDDVSLENLFIEVGRIAQTCNHCSLSGLRLGSVFSNNLPSVSAVSVDSGATSVTLTESTTTSVSCAGTVTDLDGFVDIERVDAHFYRSAFGSTTPNQINYKYSASGDTECVPSGGAGNSETYTCTFDVSYLADSTDVGSQYEVENWLCEMFAVDATATGTPATDDVEMASLFALDVTSPIDYGTLAPSTDTGAINPVATTTNTGNQAIDVEIGGNNLAKGATDNIGFDRQKYSTSTFTYATGGTTLPASTTPNILDLDLDASIDVSSAVRDVTYWGLGILDGHEPGTYTGLNFFTGVAGTATNPVLDYIFYTNNDGFWNSVGSTAVNVDDPSNFSTVTGAGRQVVRTSLDVLYAVFNDAGNCEVWKSADDGATWAEQDAVNAPACNSNAARNAVAVAVDSGDKLHIGYTDDADNTVTQYIVFDTTIDTFRGEEQVNNAGSQVQQTYVAIDENSIPHMVFVERVGNPNRDVLYTNRVGGTWKAPVTVNAAGAQRNHAIAMTLNEDNVPEVSFINLSLGDLHAAEGNLNDATSFTLHTVDAVVNTSNNVPMTSIGVSASGDTWIGYVDENGGTDFVTLAQHPDASAWTTGWTTTTNSNAGTEPSIAIEANDIQLFYEEDNNDIAYDTYDGVWAGETVLETGTFSDVKVKWQYYYNN